MAQTVTWLLFVGLSDFGSRRHGSNLLHRGGRLSRQSICQSLGEPEECLESRAAAPYCDNPPHKRKEGSLQNKDGAIEFLFPSQAQLSDGPFFPPKCISEAFPASSKRFCARGANSSTCRHSKEPSTARSEARGSHDLWRLFDKMAAYYSKITPTDLCRVVAAGWIRLSGRSYQTIPG